MLLGMAFFLPAWAGLVFGADRNQSDPSGKKSTEQAIFAGGCFWCVESDFEKIEGVKEVVSGYTGGAGEHPTYDDYARKGHVEAALIKYDPSVIDYEELLNLFWVRIDPSDAGGQFCDRGHEYTSAIFYLTNQQKETAEKSKAALAKSGMLNQPVVTPILPAADFYPAEEYHQQYYQKHAIKYKYYRYRCGRDRRLKELWGDATRLMLPGK